MILLLANPSPARAALISFLDQSHLPAKAVSTLAECLEAPDRSQPFELAVIDFRFAGGGRVPVLLKLLRRRHGSLTVVLSAPLHAEAALLEAGAMGGFGPGYSPRSGALQCANLAKLLALRPHRGKGARPRHIPDFKFGDGCVSPEKRLLRRNGPTGKAMAMPLTRIQLRLLQAWHDSPGVVLTYEALCATVWRRAYGGKTSAIREAISALRSVFHAAGMDLDRWAANVRGEGFRYDPKPVGGARLNPRAPNKGQEGLQRPGRPPKRAPTGP